MKKFMSLLTVVILIGTFVLSESNAQPSGKGKMGNQSNLRGSKFIDANGDGVCDNVSTGKGYRNNGKNKQNFVDADGDGVCDNNTGGTIGTNKNTQSGQGKRNQGKTRPNFVDADGDGICDYYQK